MKRESRRRFNFPAKVTRKSERVKERERRLRERTSLELGRSVGRRTGIVTFYKKNEKTYLPLDKYGYYGFVTVSLHDLFTVYDRF